MLTIEKDLVLVGISILEKVNFYKNPEVQLVSGFLIFWFLELIARENEFSTVQHIIHKNQFTDNNSF